MTTPGQRLYAAFVSGKRAKGGSLSADDFIRIGDELVSMFREEWAREAKARKRKEGVIDPRAQPIFNVYPKRKGGKAALKSISDAIAEDGFDLVLSQTTKYATAVARWKKEEREFIPLATTFYNQRRYKLDDEKEWFKGEVPAEKAAPTKHIPAPSGWLLWATNKRAEWERENDGYTAPGERAILDKNFFALPGSWQQECREQLTQMKQA